jgi:hypothetical protein
MSEPARHEHDERAKPATKPWRHPQETASLQSTLGADRNVAVLEMPGFRNAGLKNASPKKASPKNANGHEWQGARSSGVTCCHRGRPATEPLSSTPQGLHRRATAFMQDWQSVVHYVGKSFSKG